MGMVAQLVCWNNAYTPDQGIYGVTVSMTALAISTFGFPFGLINSTIADICALAVSFLNFPLIWYGKTIGLEVLHNVVHHVENLVWGT